MWCKSLACVRNPILLLRDWVCVSDGSPRGFSGSWVRYSVRDVYMVNVGKECRYDPEQTVSLSKLTCLLTHKRGQTQEVQQNLSFLWCSCGVFVFY